MSPIVVSNDPAHKEAARRAAKEVRPFMRANRLAREKVSQRWNRIFFFVAAAIILGLGIYVLSGISKQGGSAVSRTFSFGTIASCV